eukprot:gene6094-biopygen5825
MVPTWYQHGTSWYQHGTNMVPTWSRHAPDMGTDMVYTHAQQLRRNPLQHGTNMVPDLCRHSTMILPSWFRVLMTVVTTAGARVAQARAREQRKWHQARVHNDPANPLSTALRTALQVESGMVQHGASLVNVASDVSQSIHRWARCHGRCYGREQGCVDCGPPTWWPAPLGPCGARVSRARGRMSRGVVIRGSKYEVSLPEATRRPSPVCTRAGTSHEEQVQQIVCAHRVGRRLRGGGWCLRGVGRRLRDEVVGDFVAALGAIVVGVFVKWLASSWERQRGLVGVCRAVGKIVGKPVAHRLAVVSATVSHLATADWVSLDATWPLNEGSHRWQGGWTESCRPLGGCPESGSQSDSDSDSDLAEI